MELGIEWWRVGLQGRNSPQELTCVWQIVQSANQAVPLAMTAMPKINCLAMISLSFAVDIDHAMKPYQKVDWERCSYDWMGSKTG